MYLLYCIDLKYMELENMEFSLLKKGIHVGMAMQITTLLPYFLKHNKW